MSAARHAGDYDELRAADRVPRCLSPTRAGASWFADADIGWLFIEPIDPFGFATPTAEKSDEPLDDPWLSAVGVVHRR